MPKKIGQTLDLVEITFTVSPNQVFPQNRVQILILRRHDGRAEMRGTLTPIGWYEPVDRIDYSLWRKLVNHPTPHWTPDLSLSLGPFKCYPEEEVYGSVTYSYYCRSCGTGYSGLHPAEPPHPCARPRWRMLGRPTLAWACLACQTGFEVPTWFRPQAVSALGCPACKAHEFVPLSYVPFHRIETVAKAFEDRGSVCLKCLDLAPNEGRGCPQHPGLTLGAGGDLHWLQQAAITCANHAILGFHTQLDETDFAPSRRAIMRDPVFHRLDLLSKLPFEMQCCCTPGVCAEMPTPYDSSQDILCDTCKKVMVASTMAYHFAYRDTAP